MDLFKKFDENLGPLGQYMDDAHGYFSFPKLEGQIAPRMGFMGKEMLNWSINNYLGLANHPEVREADAQAAKDWGMAYPMGARMMSGQTRYHEQLEDELAAFVNRPKAYLLNFGYQGMVSIIQALVNRRDVIVYDSEAHACILDGMQLHFGKRYVYPHNDIEKLEKQLQRATKLADANGGGVLVITEGVYGMAGDLGKLDEIVRLKEKYEFRLFIDDAHGFGTMGATGAGTDEYFGVQDQVDVYFATFAKSMAGIGAFVAGEEKLIKFLMYNMRSQVFAKSLPMPMVIGALKRLDMIRRDTVQKDKLWTIVRALQAGLKKAGFDIGKTKSPVTPVYFSGGLEEATHIIYDLRENFRLFTSIVVYPVVPKGVIMIRLIPTAAHSLEDVEYTVNAFAEVKAKLLKGEYDLSDMKKMTVK
jgi:glycine C-acetyltransferase